MSSTILQTTSKDSAQVSAQDSMAELTDAELLFPLSQFFASSTPQVREIETPAYGSMPEPYRELLVHSRDMTSTLERFHRETLALRLIERRRQGDFLLRQVVLIGEETGCPYELGAIRIDLDAFESEAREMILLARRPLGSILAHFSVPYLSQPKRFFRLDSDVWLEDLFHLDTSQELYGRQNVLSDPSGRPLAEVVEILPPIQGED